MANNTSAHITVRRFELVNFSSMKFWEINTSTGEAKYGRIGDNGRRHNHSPYHVKSKVQEKLKKGYIEVTNARHKIFIPGMLVKFRTNEPATVKKWLSHSQEAWRNIKFNSVGTVVSIEKTVPCAPHWNIYNVLAGGALCRCAGIYMEQIKS